MTDKGRHILVTNLDPLKILQVFGAEDYENMVEDWQREFLEKKYVRVERLGGKGDKGRDVVCTDTNNDSYIYQCKHYGKKLGISDILFEIGKYCYHCFKKDYKTAKKYRFVSPCGVTTEARDLLNSPEKLKEHLKVSWEKTCQTKIISSEEIKLEGNMLTFIDGFDFSIFDYISPTEFLDELKKANIYTKWFGELCKPRKFIDAAPEEIRKDEFNYIRKIFEAYSEYLKNNIEDEKKLKETNPELWDHFNRQRLYFYSAEYLAAWSRETFPPDFHCFEQLKDEIYHGIIDEIQQDAQNGFERLNNVLKIVDSLVIRLSNPLSSEANIRDRRGICHHLANERDDIKWKK